MVFWMNKIRPNIGKTDTISIDEPKANHFNALILTPSNAKKGISIGNKLTNTVKVIFYK